MRLKNKICIVTGGGDGIGRATAVKFAEEGAVVAVADINEKAIEETVNIIKQKGNMAEGFKVDVTQKDQINEMVSKIMENYKRIDVLVNNAGIVKDAQLYKMSDEQFEQVINVNLKGVYLCTRAVIDIMISQNSGVILNTSSIVGLYGNFGQTNYAASKAALIGMTRTWAKELGRKGIRCNAVCPGFIATPILKSMPEKVLLTMEEKVPMRRLGKPEEVANVFAFLASDEASYVNGAIVEVSGGLII
ncbi:3-oxoacyl-ACP reductase FabG [Thermovenabulum gondwanense]|uniref:3-oxoacyl-[acyl-carrier-protein] reductase n=1 Tax=Thermovenabulum gondwanense TaxID=520767 RepID=A0A161PW90_9FIRM|nr:3-oxoacyl-ACP reductase FabG [Thermovenabulum gondwanense]KYO65386.1 putative oxidoreductase [Thermovenabulum gondwanense]